LASCVETTAAGKPCRLPAQDGLDRCWVHAGVGPVGRPTLLTPETAEALVAMLRAGNYLHVACRAAGIARQTFQDWMERGLSEEDADAEYRALRTRVERARAEGHMRLVSLIANAATTDWRAASWLLERSYPKLWGGVSVTLRSEPEPEEATILPEADGFSEFDELAARRRERTG